MFAKKIFQIALLFPQRTLVQPLAVCLLPPSLMVAAQQQPGQPLENQSVILVILVMKSQVT